ncbi:hypothetical protein [Nocardia salmonicida]|uniref:hypothetical protein n=1 Tax=Nocardia salmonicida TaxID=53431 RepID=UPI0037B6D2C2
MTEQPETPPAETSVAARTCQFPTGFDAEANKLDMCGRPLDDGAPRPGRKKDYCGADRVDPDGVRRTHDRATAFQRKRELQLAAVGKVPAQRERATPRPVTSARASLADLLAQFEMVSASHREQLTGLIDRAAEIVATAGDPDAAVAEVAQMRRDAQAEIDAARSAAEEAESEAINARRERDRAIEDRDLADGAAEDFLAARDAALVEAEQLVETARTEAAQEIETVQAAAAGEVAEAQRAAAAAEERTRAAEAEVLEEKERATAQIETIRRDEAARVERIIADTDAQVSAAAAAQQRAEAEARASEQRATEARAELARVRDELDAARTQAREDVATAREVADTAVTDAKQRADEARAELARVREELDALRSDSRAEREQQRADHTAELARVQSTHESSIATLNQALATAESALARLTKEPKE